MNDSKLINAIENSRNLDTARLSYDEETSNHILGVGQGATVKGIKKTYRHLSLQFQPNKHPGDEYKLEKFTTIAYEMLLEKFQQFAQLCEEKCS